jgi:hypothetical protein
MKCQRCCTREEATYRVCSDIIDMKVCVVSLGNSVRISTLVDISTQHLHGEHSYKKKPADSEPLLHLYSSYVAVLHIVRCPKKSNPLAGLA